MDMGEKNPIVDPSDHDGFLVRFICNLLSTFDFISLYFFLSISDLTIFIFLMPYPLITKSPIDQSIDPKVPLILSTSRGCTSRVSNGIARRAAIVLQPMSLIRVSWFNSQ